MSPCVDFFVSFVREIMLLTLLWFLNDIVEKGEIGEARE